MFQGYSFSAKSKGIRVCCYFKVESINSLELKVNSLKFKSPLNVTFFLQQGVFPYLHCRLD